MGGFVEDHGALLRRQGLQMRPAVFFVHRQKALEGKPSGRQSGHRQGGDKGAGAGDGHHGNIRLGTALHQQLTWVADGRRAGICDQRTALTGHETP